MSDPLRANRLTERLIAVRHSSRARDAAALLVILAVWLLFFWRVFAMRAIDRVQFVSGDFTQQFLVFRSFAFDELKQGRLPLWLPCINSGYPYQADPQSALFYPPALLNLELNVAAGASQFSIGALEMEAALHILLAAVFLYGFLRGEVRGRSSAVLGALVFAFGGYLTGYPILQLAILESVTWLPLALWAARRLAARGDARSLVVLAIALALSVLAGHPQTYTFVFYAVTLYFVYRARREKIRWNRLLIRLAGAIGLALMLSAIQLLPTLEYLRLSSRAELSFAQSATGLPLSDLLQIFAANVVSHFNPLYIGWLPLACAALAITTPRKNTDALLWTLIALAGGLISFGGHLTLFDGVYWLLPGYSLFRDQERNALLFSLAASILAAYGADIWLHSLSRRIRGIVRTQTRWLLLAVSGLLIILVVTAYSNWRGANSAIDRVLANHLALALLAAFATWLMWHAARRSGRFVRSGYAPIALLLIAAIDLVTANRSINWTPIGDPFSAQPSIVAIQSASTPGEIFRVHNEQRLPGHSLCMGGLNEVGGITPIVIEAYDRFIKSVPREVRWSLLNVHYLVTYRSELLDRLDQLIDATLLAQQGEGKDAIYTYQLKQDHPRAWVVHEVEVKPDRSAIFAALAAPDFDPQRVAYTMEPVSTEPGGGDQVQVISIEPSRLVVDAALNSPGLLVLSEVNYPGWQAAVNGQPVNLIEVDGLLRGLPLPAGLSRVELVYQPAALMIGAVLTTVGMLACGLLIMLARRRTSQV
jgi:hypothetical protein